MTTVMVVGGYGAVGRVLCEELSQEPGLDIVVAGRHLSAAEALATKLAVEGRRIDLHLPKSWQDACAGIDVVVMCMDQTETDFVAFLFERGIHYVDITASDGFFQKLERMGTPPGVSALLSVGLAPGLTNLMAAHCAARFETANKTEIALMSGMGDAHGDAAIKWLADQLFDPSKEPRSTLVDFGGAWEVRKVHAVDFSDQHALMRTLPVGRVTTSVCLDSRLATHALFGFARLFRGSSAAQALAVSLFSHFQMGSTVCNVAVEVTGECDGVRKTVSARFFAQSESLTTAGLAAVMICTFIRARPSSGIWHSHQVFDPEAVFAEIGRRAIGNIEFEHCGPAGASSEPVIHSRRSQRTGNR